MGLKGEQCSKHEKVEHVISGLPALHG